MTAELIKALEESRQPAWAESVSRWTPDGGDDSYYRMIDGPRLVTTFGDDSALAVLPQVHQNTASGDHAGLMLMDLFDPNKPVSLLDDLTVVEARELAAALIKGAELIEQWTEAKR